jgi:glycosyltransferase involved in cell wall biosynthesis
MKVFAISHSSVVGRFRRKWTELSTFPDVHLTLLVPRWWPEGGARVRYEPNGPAGYRILSRPTAFTGTHALHFYPTLAADLLAVRPAIVHVEEEPWNLVTLQAACLARALGARVVFFTWENVWRRYPFPLPVFLRSVLRLADRAIAGGAQAREVLRRRGFRRRIDVLPQYGIDPPPPPLRTRPPSTVFTVGFAGRLVPQKGLHTLLDAVSPLGAGVRLLVVGEGPYRAALMDRAAMLGIAERIELTGAVAHDRMHEHLTRMDVLVLPSLTTSRWKEQFGRVLVEAMALGVPVVGSSSGEIPSVIGDDGLVFPEADAAALRHRLQSLIDDVRFRRELAERGRARAVTRYTNRAIATATREIYQQCVAAA